MPRKSTKKVIIKKHVKRTRHTKRRVGKTHSISHPLRFGPTPLRFGPALLRFVGAGLTPRTEDIELEPIESGAEGSLVSLEDPEHEFDYVVGKNLVEDYYEISLLGKGGFGSVYSSRRHNDPEKYAVKVIDLSSVRENEAKLVFKIKSLDNEVEILRRLLEHCREYFVCFKDAMRDSATLRFFIVCEELEGYVPLSSYGKSKEYRATVRSRDLSIPFLRIMENLCDGLYELHKLGIAHRDIKTDNILVRPDTYQIKYIDFGLACNVRAPELHMQCNSTAGTPNYMDPILYSHERRKPTYLLSTDYWSLGIVLFWMLAGKHPWQIIYPSIKPNEIHEVYSVRPFWRDSSIQRVFERSLKYQNHALETQSASAFVGDLLHLDWRMRRIYILNVPMGALKFDAIPVPILSTDLIETTETLESPQQP